MNALFVEWKGIKEGAGIKLVGTAIGIEQFPTIPRPGEERLCVCCKRRSSLLYSLSLYPTYRWIGILPFMHNIQMVQKWQKSQKQADYNPHISRLLWADWHPLNSGGGLIPFKLEVLAGPCWLLVITISAWSGRIRFDDITEVHLIRWWNMAHRRGSVWLGQGGGWLRTDVKRWWGEVGSINMAFGVLGYFGVLGH